MEEIICTRDIQGNVLPKFIELYMELIRMSSNMADLNQQTHLLPSFATNA